ncbi:hypothetical protein [Halalkalibacter sp. APA_J-10(15)]|uniref:hypothetical protein n=1 Tax=unclassified Halalkalibacter TaxID=2893063 RepID=UPI001FF40104|nr:hypothetical protein [Halalkalibacter sp. APA_J-10(15)]MCK0472482.1 hypothetical protein [Halalkalibacter sp. APA_J-10(15)]
MNLYFQNYITIIKTNFMLIIIALMLLFVTFFIWAGLPFFVIGNTIDLFTNHAIMFYVSISLSGGFLFSLYFLPINLKVAKSIAAIKERGVVRSFLQIQLIWVFVCSVLFGTVLYILIQLG